MAVGAHLQQRLQVAQRAHVRIGFVDQREGRGVADDGVGLRGRAHVHLAQGQVKGVAPGPARAHGFAPAGPVVKADGCRVQRENPAALSQVSGHGLALSVAQVIGPLGVRVSANLSCGMLQRRADRQQIKFFQARKPRVQIVRDLGGDAYLFRMRASVGAASVKGWYMPPVRIRFFTRLSPRDLEKGAGHHAAVHHQVVAVDIAQRRRPPGTARHWQCLLAAQALERHGVAADGAGLWVGVDGRAHAAVDKAGETVLTRMPRGPHSSAISSLSFARPALLAA